MSEIIRGRINYRTEEILKVIKEGLSLFLSGLIKLKVNKVTYL
jgi:hypothetical protein